ncbi:hypothetical protein PG995_007416 [Apiospora arundinis]
MIKAIQAKCDGDGNGGNSDNRLVTVDAMILEVGSRPAMRGKMRGVLGLHIAMQPGELPTQAVGRQSLRRALDCVSGGTRDVACDASRCPHGWGTLSNGSSRYKRGHPLIAINNEGGSCVGSKKVETATNLCVVEKADISSNANHFRMIIETDIASADLRPEN